MKLRYTLILLLIAIGSTAVAEPLNVCLISGSAEYDSDTSLLLYKKHLTSRYDITCTLLKAKGFYELKGLEALDRCDVALFFTRRLVIDGEELAAIKRYVESGKPIVAVRTASHGFQNYLEFDKEVLGGNYHDHFGNKKTQSGTLKSQAKRHAIMQGIGNDRFRSPYSLYKTGLVAEDVNVLLYASIPGEEPQASAWTRVINGQRIFYTAMGGLSDFENASFLRMLTNALYWVSDRDIPEPAPMKSIEVETLPGLMTMNLRTRMQPFKSKNEWRELTIRETFKTEETAIIICDMWDRHWCEGASIRCEDLAVKMNPIVSAARDFGVTIIHAPSDTLSFYADWPQRLRMINAPAFPLPEVLEISSHPLPIDDSDEGCDTPNSPYGAWSRQSHHITIADEDGISDKGYEVYNYLKANGIKNVIMMGVHTNMCVLGRSFAIRNLSRWGFKCVLVRDLTDAMYSSDDYPYVSHDTGTQLVVEHIEKYWCPTILSAEFLEGLQ